MLELPSEQLTANRSKDSPKNAFFALAGWLLITSAILFAASFRMSAPLWLQPSLIGLLWSNWFFAGLILGVWKGGSKLMFAALIAIVSASAFKSLTDFSLLEGLMLCAPSVAVGRWLGGKLVSRMADDVDSSEGKSQWSILDLLLLTTGVAVVIGATQSRSTPWPMLMVVTLTLLAGLILSWSAVLVVFRDVNETLPARRSEIWISRIYVSFCIIALVSLCIRNEFMVILWSGPVPVVAAQGCFALVSASLLRLSVLDASKSRKLAVYRAT